MKENVAKVGVYRMRGFPFAACVAALSASLLLPAVAAGSDASAPAADSAAERKAAAEVAARLARMPRPWALPPNVPALEEIHEALRFWAEKNPGLMEVQVRGRSASGLPILLAKVTDSAIPDEDKQRVVVTGLHAGPERNGATAIMRYAEWLLGDSPEACETRKRQVLLLMPVVNPYAYVTNNVNGNEGGFGIYDSRRGALWDIPNLKLREPEKVPEIAAFAGVVDEYQPEAHVDMHGVGLRWNGERTTESAGTAYSNYGLRAWDMRVSDRMIRAANEAGYGIDRAEADAQRLFWGPDMDAHRDRFWHGRTFFYTASYAYVRCHTLLSTAEVSWEESGVARLKAFVGIGNHVWPGERLSGYPVHVLKSMQEHQLVSWGRTAAERRRSRMELWTRQGSFAVGLLYPQTDCRTLVALGLTARGCSLLEPSLAAFYTNLAACADMNAPAVRAFVQAGPELKLYKEAGEIPPTDAPLLNGLALRLRISCPNPDLLDLRLNGQLLKESDADGYQRWAGDGWTVVQVNVPPAKASKLDVCIVSCAYDPRTTRDYGWQAPPEVRARVKSSKNP